MLHVTNGEMPADFDPMTFVYDGATQVALTPP